jgi:hypothetical protein
MEHQAVQAAVAELTEQMRLPAEQGQPIKVMQVELYQALELLLILVAAAAALDKLVQ